MNLKKRIFEILKEANVADDDAKDFFKTLSEAGLLANLKVYELLGATIDEEELMFNYEFYKKIMGDDKND